MAYDNKDNGKGDATPTPKPAVFDNKAGNYTRDDSAGPDAKPYNAVFGDGGHITKSA